MHHLYKEVPLPDVYRVIDYCRSNTVKDGGLFEVYSTPGEDLHMIIVNSCSEDEPAENFRPLGGFYCNYMRPGAISIEDEDPRFDGMPSTKRHIKAVKQVIDILLKEARPGVSISFNDLPALK